MNELRATSLDSLEPDSWSAEAAANRLMDDVFADIDQLLGDRPPAQGASFGRSPGAESPPLQSVLVAQGDLISPPYEPPFPPEAMEAELITKRGWSYYTERLLLICACASVLGGVLWLVANDQFKKPQFLNGPVTPANDAAAPDDSVATSDFANYIQRALDNIDRRANGTEDATTTGAGNQDPQVIERIYIPIYSPNMAADNGAATSQGPVILPPPPNPAPMLVPPPPPISMAPTAIVPPPAPRPATPTLDNGSIPTPTSVAAAPTTMYALVGILEAGDRSEALFRINGTTQRFGLGEELGRGSWKLIAAQNNQVILERAGQTRTVYVGQEFPSN
ncbi:hypothetical protein NIES970_19650 [[Synechococcus] sp. NIES-970]|nr:hypothetical protein NIES970_19650 [[Synechococcus] sp. NIES-970]